MEDRSMASVSPTPHSVKPRKGPKRTYRLGKAVHGVYPLLLTIGKKRYGYYVFPLASDFGRAFKLVKFSCDVEPDGASEYDVCLDGTRSQCECLGFLRHGHCKHVESLVALVEGGAL
jgi:hypothetical protein